MCTAVHTVHINKQFLYIEKVAIHVHRQILSESTNDDYISKFLKVSSGPNPSTCKIGLSSQLTARISFGPKVQQINCHTLYFAGW